MVRYILTSWKWTPRLHSLYIYAALFWVSAVQRDRRVSYSRGIDLVPQFSSLQLCDSGLYWCTKGQDLEPLKRQAADHVFEDFSRFWSRKSHPKAGVNIPSGCWTRLNKEKKLNQTQGFIRLCYLAEDVDWPRASGFCFSNLPTLVVCLLIT